jgi:DNA-binding SARP family transcriptional activator/TolB-like protein
MLRLRLFGGLTVADSSGPLDGSLTQPRRLAVLALAAAAGPAGVRRSAVLALLWPDSDEARASHVLAQTLYATRRAAGGLELVTGTATLRLNPVVITSDAGDFDAALEAGDREAAVLLHSGPFLDGFRLPGAPEFERWVEEERQRRLQRVLHAVETLAEQAEAAGNLQAAAGWWRRAAAQDPFSSRIATRLIGVLDRAGDRAAALQHGRVHELLLRSELELDVGPEVAALLQKLRQAPGPPAAAGLPPGAAADRRGGGGLPGKATPAATSATAQRPAEASPDPAAGTDVPSSPEPRPPARQRTPMRLPAAVALLVVVLAAAAAVVLPRGGTPAAVRPDLRSAPSVAVMDLEELVPDTGVAYLGPGLAAEITVRLGATGRLRVRSPRAVRNLGASADARAAAALLAVDYLLEGTVLRAADSVRVAVHLTRGGDGFTVWNGAYRTTLQELHRLPGTIAREVAAHLRVADPAGAHPLERHVFADPRAYDRYLRGNRQLDRRTPESVLRAIAEYEEASRLDPEFAAALARRAYAYALFLDWGWQHPTATPPQLLADGLALAQRALRLDGESADALLAQAYLLVARDPVRMTGAIDVFERLLASHRGDAEVWHQYGQTLMVLGRSADAEGAYRMALELEPDRAMTLVALHAIALGGARYDEAGRLADSAVAADPGNAYALAVRAGYHTYRGDHSSALRDAETAVRIDRGHPVVTRGTLAAVLASHGDTTAALRELDAAIAAVADARAPSPTEARFLIQPLLVLGRREEALDVLESARPRSAWLRFYLSSPHFESLRSEPRFIAVFADQGPASASGQLVPP